MTFKKVKPSAIKCQTKVFNISIFTEKMSIWTKKKLSNFFSNFFLNSVGNTKKWIKILSNFFGRLTFSCKNGNIKDLVFSCTWYNGWIDSFNYTDQVWKNNITLYHRFKYSFNGYFNEFTSGSTQIGVTFLSSGFNLLTSFATRIEFEYLVYASHWWWTNTK